MTLQDKRDHYHCLYYNRMVCAPDFEVDRRSGGLPYKVGDYYLFSQIGHGGGGTVYEGRHKNTNQRVAIKVVGKNVKEEARAKAIHDDPEVCHAHERRGSEGKNESQAYAKKIQRTRKEYTVMSHLRDHRNITKLLDVIENDRAICLVMELGTGGDLFQLVQQKGRLSLDESWHIFRQLVSAVSYIHSKGFVHRDIKPENVFVSENHETVMLGDFGFADVWSSFKELKEGVGSLNYCSPEIVCGHSYTGPEVDIWSLGACLYAMVTGNLPFAAATPKQVVTNIKSGNFTLAGCSEADPLLYDLLLRLLNPNCFERAKMSDILAHRWFRNGPTFAHIMKDRRKRVPSSTSVTATVSNRHRTRVQ